MNTHFHTQTLIIFFSICFWTLYTIELYSLVEGELFTFHDSTATNRNLRLSSTLEDSDDFILGSVLSLTHSRNEKKKAKKTSDSTLLMSAHTTRLRFKANRLETCWSRSREGSWAAESQNHTTKKTYKREKLKLWKIKSSLDDSRRGAKKNSLFIFKFLRYFIANLVDLNSSFDECQRNLLYWLGIFGRCWGWMEKLRSFRLMFDRQKF